MSAQERPRKIIHDLATNQPVELPVTDGEWDEIKAKQARAEVLLQEQAAAIAAEAVEAARVKDLVDKRPSDADISSAKDIAGLKVEMLKQNALIDVLLKKLGLIS